MEIMNKSSVASFLFLSLPCGDTGGLLDVLVKVG